MAAVENATKPKGAITPAGDAGSAPRNRPHRRCRAALLAVFLLMPFTGCQSFSSGNGMIVDNMFVRYRDRVWAARAYNEQYGGRIIHLGKHHRRGFIDGYCSVCQGGDGFVPPVPPSDYWTSQYQSEQGSKCVNAWFEAFPEGAQTARSDKAGNYGSLYVSQMLDAAITQEKNAVRLPSETKIVDRADLPESTGGPEKLDAELQQGPLPLPNRDWTMVFPDRNAASSRNSSAAAGEQVR